MTTHGPRLGLGVSSVNRYDGSSSSRGALMTMLGTAVLVSHVEPEEPLTPGLKSPGSSLSVCSRVSISKGDSDTELGEAPSKVRNIALKPVSTSHGGPTPRGLMELYRGIKEAR
jgi:hypothetical protein